MKAKIEEVCGVKVFKGISDDSLNRILVCGDIVDLKKNACLYHGSLKGS